MNIVIVGLGLIGGSYAEGLTRKGHDVYGVDVSLESLNYALSKGIIKKYSIDLIDFIELADLIIFAIYPTLILDYLKKYNFKEGQVITDVLGVKSSYLEMATSLAKPALYCSHHPMAGREKIGIKYSDYKIFKDANFLITTTKDTKEEAIDKIKLIADDLEFGKISIIDEKVHDKMIGFTSQLTHAIAISLVNSETNEDTKDFIGDSYRDLTRIAKINEKLWVELFLENKDNLLEHIDHFINELTYQRNLIENNDIENMKEYFLKAKQKRETYDK